MDHQNLENLMQSKNWSDIKNGLKTILEIRISSVKL